MREGGHICGTLRYIVLHVCIAYLHVPDKAQSGRNCGCASVKWRICACTEWLVNVIAKHCSGIISTNCTHVHHSLRTDILAVEGFGLTKYWLMNPPLIHVNLAIKIQPLLIHCYIRLQGSQKHQSTRRQSQTSWTPAPQKATPTYPIRLTDCSIRCKIDDQPGHIAQRDKMEGGWLKWAVRIHHLQPCHWIAHSVHAGSV